MITLNIKMIITHDDDDDVDVDDVHDDDDDDVGDVCKRERG